MVHKDRENLTMYNFYFPFYGPAHKKEGTKGKKCHSTLLSASSLVNHD